MNKTYVCIISFLIIVMLAVCVQSCGTLSVAGDVADATKVPSEVVTEFKDELNVSGGTHFMFYALGALCFAVAGGVILVMKDTKTALIFVGLGFIFVTVPMYLETLVIMLGVFKIVIYVGVFALLTAGLFVLFLKMRNIYHDLAHPDEDDKHPETAKIVDAAKKKVAIKKIKSEGA